MGLNNCVQVDAMGNLGTDQLALAEKPDLGGLSASTPVVLFAHIPLWMVYEKWGWGTQDGATALSYGEAFCRIGHGLERAYPSDRAEG